MVLSSGLTLAAIGVVAGVAVALLTTRLFRGLLHDVTPADPLTFAAVASGTRSSWRSWPV